MDFNTEFKIVSKEEIAISEALKAITEFEEENIDVEGIYRIQINEIRRVLKFKVELLE